jgi:hypothetical protein
VRNGTRNARLWCGLMRAVHIGTQGGDFPAFSVLGIWKGGGVNPALRVLLFAETPRVFAAPDRPHGRGRFHHPRGCRPRRPDLIHWIKCKTALDPRSEARVCIRSLQELLSRCRHQKRCLIWCHPCQRYRCQLELHQFLRRSGLQFRCRP